MEKSITKRWSILAMVAIIPALAAVNADAQTACVNNLDAGGNVCTTFTLGAANTQQ
jgi:hypothetical protein